MFKKGHIPWWVERGVPHPMKDSKIAEKVSDAKRGKKYPEDEYPNHGMRGKHHSKKTIIKLKKALKGHPMYEDKKRNEKISETKMGHITTEATRRNISNACKGRKTWNKGLTKEEDERVRRYTESANKTKREKGLYGLTKGKHYKSISESKMGSKNPSWRGGKSFEPYSPEFNGELKRRIMERDGNRCRFDGYRDEPPYSSHKGRLTIHHIDYDKKNADPGNLITLCNRHNTMVNKDREYWMKEFKKIMEEKLCQKKD